MTTFQDDLSAALAMIRGGIGESITYSRGDDEVTVTAVIGRSTYEVDSLDGVFTEIAAVDFLVKASDLVLDSQEVQPARGDSITWGTRLFEVLGGAVPPSHPSDPQGQTVRVHTKEVGT